MLVDALTQAALRGVSVKVLLDSYGAKGLERTDYERLVQSGVAVRYFNPPTHGRLKTSLTRDHRKLMLVDQHVAFTGGYCITDEFLDEWHDVAIRVEGPVTEDWEKLFVRLWSDSLTQGSHEEALDPQTEAHRQQAPRESSKQGMKGRVVWGRGGSNQTIRFSLQQRIANASRRVWIHTPYFLPTFSLRRRLMEAVRRGVDVRLLLAGKSHDHPSVLYAGRHYYGRLLRNGIRIYEYQPTFTHAKLCIVDDWSTIGSCNFDHWSLRWNLEANQEVEDRHFAADIVALFEKDLTDSKEILPTEWAQRAWRQRGRERVLGTLSGWANLLH